MESESGVIVLAVVKPRNHFLVGVFFFFTLELLTVPVSYEILGSGAAERSTGVDGNEEDVFVVYLH